MHTGGELTTLSITIIRHAKDLKAEIPQNEIFAFKPIKKCMQSGLLHHKTLFSSEGCRQTSHINLQHPKPTTKTKEIQLKHQSA